MTPSTEAKSAKSEKVQFTTGSYEEYEKVEEKPPRSQTSSISDTSTSSKGRRATTLRPLTISSPAKPQLSTDAVPAVSLVVSDHHHHQQQQQQLGPTARQVSMSLKSADSATSHGNTPFDNSQLRTSRFLASDNLKDPSSKLPAERGANETAVETAPASVVAPVANAKSVPQIAISRTQRKILLQRQSVPDEETASQKDGDVSSQQRVKKEIDKVNREYANVLRFRDPIGDAVRRLQAVNVID